MASQLKVIQTDKTKGKSASKTQEATAELDYLMTFNRSITQATSRTMQDLSEGVFISMINLTLTLWDSYMDYLKAGIKQDTLTVLSNSLLHMSSLFPDHLLAKVEEEIDCH